MQGAKEGEQNGTVCVLISLRAAIAAIARDSQKRYSSKLRSCTFTPLVVILRSFE